MGKNIIETVVQSREQLNKWWMENVNFENAVYAVGLLYLFVIIAYIYEAAKEGFKENNKKAGLSALGNAIGVTIGIGAGILAIIFIFPESKFTVLSYLFLENNPYVGLVFIFILIVGGFAAGTGKIDKHSFFENKEPKENLRILPMICPKCLAEYEEGTNVCPECEVELKDRNKDA